MRKVIHICVFRLTSSLVCFGQLQNMVTDDGGDSDKFLKSAKNVAVFIELGPPAATRFIPDFARAKKQVTEKLNKAGLHVVADPARADVVIVVHELNEGAIGGNGGVIFCNTNEVSSEMSNTTCSGINVMICLGDKLEVFKGGKVPSNSDTPIFSVNEYCGFSWPLNRAMDKLLKAMKR